MAVPLGRYDLERALALARWPHSDTERAQFHRRYIVAVNGPPIDGWAVDQVEVTTEFRRVELMAEEHVEAERLRGDAPACGKWRTIFGRGGDASWSRCAWGCGRPGTSVLCRRSTSRSADPAPSPRSMSAERISTESAAGDVSGCPLIGGLVEATFDAAAVGQTSRPVIVRWNGKALARVTIDFAGAGLDDDGLGRGDGLGDFSFGDFHLGDDGLLVHAIDPRPAAADQLRRAERGEHDELKPAHTGRTLNHGDPSHEGFREGSGRQALRAQKSRTSQYIAPLNRT